MPVERLRQGAACEQPDRASAGGHEREHAHRARLLAGARELGDDDRQDHARGDRPADPLQEARHDQHRLVRCRAAQDGGGGEQHDCGRIVEQAFALDQVNQACRCPELAKNRDDCRWICRCDDRSQQHRDRQGYTGNGGQAEPYSHRGNDHRDNGKHQNRRGVLEHLADVDGERGQEQQDRQKDYDECLGRERQIDQRAHDCVEYIRQRRVQQERRQAANGYSDQSKQYGFGEMGALGDRLNEADGNQDRRDCEHYHCDIDHLRGLPFASDPAGSRYSDESNWKSIAALE